MIVASSRAELDEGLDELRREGSGVALVPTMGALHEGHLGLVRAARASGAQRVVVSIFVNPLQFEDGADLARYPVDHARDLALLADEGADLAWTPRLADIYPEGHATRIEIDGPARGFEGDARPGHFSGVATVVSILFGAVRPDEAWFGEKDWQQLQVVRRLVSDLASPVSVRALPTVRDGDGLALSSRNRFLEPGMRALAPQVFRTLRAVAARLEAGDDVLDAVAEGIRNFGSAGIGVDYLALVQGATVRPIDACEPGARLITAVRLGTVRILDNIGIA